MSAAHILARYAVGERNFAGANLRGANLRGANLRSADLTDADLTGVQWPAPTSVLLAFWSDVSDQLCLELMRYDAANHPDPSAFDRWAAGGACPYAGVHVQRSANFTERRGLWSPGPALSAYALMQMLLAEKCKVEK